MQAGHVSYECLLRVLFTNRRQETTANTMSWTMFELTQHPEVQAKLRAEIRATERAMRARGVTEFTYTDFEAMPYTVAVMKVRLPLSLSISCPQPMHRKRSGSTPWCKTTSFLRDSRRSDVCRYHSVREAARDEVLPLSTPLVTKSGKTITEIPIPKDMILAISIAGYNRSVQTHLN